MLDTAHFIVCMAHNAHDILLSHTCRDVGKKTLSRLIILKSSVGHFWTGKFQLVISSSPGGETSQQPVLSCIRALHKVNSGGVHVLYSLTYCVTVQLFNIFVIMSLCPTAQLNEPSSSTDMQLSVI